MITKEVKIYQKLKTAYPFSRQMVKELPEASVLDFKNIESISASFADELLRRNHFTKIVNAKPNIKRIIEAVQNRT